MRIIITRHGETEENIAGIIQGHLPGRLSPLGIEQARKVALRLRDEAIEFIYSSDLARAVDTTKEIAKHHPNAPVQFTKDLREKFLGIWQGKTKDELGLTTSTNYVEVLPAGIETPDEMFNRAKNFFNALLTKHPNNTILLSGHNGINKALIAVITGGTVEEMKRLDNQHNASVTVYEIDGDGGCTIRECNCVKHLERE